MDLCGSSYSLQGLQFAVPLTQSRVCFAVPPGFALYPDFESIPACVRKCCRHIFCFSFAVLEFRVILWDILQP